MQAITAEFRASQPGHRQYFGSDSSLSQGTLLCTGGCLATSSHEMPAMTFHKSENKLCEGHCIDYHLVVIVFFPIRTCVNLFLLTLSIKMFCPQPSHYVVSSCLSFLSSLIHSHRSEPSNLVSPTLLKPSHLC